MPPSPPPSLSAALGPSWTVTAAHPPAAAWSSPAPPTASDVLCAIAAARACGVREVELRADKRALEAATRELGGGGWTAAGLVSAAGGGLLALLASHRSTAGPSAVLSPARAAASVLSQPPAPSHPSEALWAALGRLVADRPNAVLALAGLAVLAGAGTLVYGVSRVRGVEWEVTERGFRFVFRAQ